jgi:glucosamine-6-phosphate deaminase
MEVIILQDAGAVAEKAADWVSQVLAYKPSTGLGLATGSTPIALYRQLIQRYQQGSLSFRQTITFNLDEYLGLCPEHPQSYRSFMSRNLFDHVDIQPANIYLPECGEGDDPRSVGDAYERQIADSGGIDLQILGIGNNGHIGFNEPTSSLGSRTRVKTLARSTIQNNSQLLNAGEFQPHLAITMGIATIMDAQRILLMATGEHKADAVKAAIEGAISAMTPASVLQQHQRVRVIVDEPAASKLELTDYYRWVHHESKSIAADHGGAEAIDPWFR